MPTPTFTIPYKSTPIPIEIDVYSPPPTSSTPTPVLVYLHAGALFYGDKQDYCPGWMIKGCSDRGWTFVSANYRLLPESGVEDVIQDLKDLWAFVLGPLSDELSKRDLPVIDDKRAFLSGGSAGGYLTVLGGYTLSPPPKALVSLYGYSFSDPTFSTPHSPDDRCMDYRLGDTEELEAKGEFQSFFKKGKAPVSSRRINGWDRDSLLYHWMFYRGTYFEKTFGIPSYADVSSRPELQQYFPLYNLPKTSTYPPIFLGHGKKDTSIPYTQTLEVADMLKSRGFAYELAINDHGEHFFDQDDEGEGVERVKDDIWRFLEKVCCCMKTAKYPVLPSQSSILYNVKAI